MNAILWAKAEYGKVLESREHANHIVLEVDERPRLMRPPFHWATMNFEGNWEIGFVLETPVRLRPFPDGGEPRQGPLTFLNDVVTDLEYVYGGRRVMRYMNPEHPDNTVWVDENAKGAKMRDLLNRRAAGGRKGGKSRSDAKVGASIENLAKYNQPRQEAAEERIERIRHGLGFGLTIAEIADKEGVTSNAIRCCLKKAKRAEVAEAARIEQERAEWIARKEARNEPEVFVFEPVAAPEDPWAAWAVPNF